MSVAAMHWAKIQTTGSSSAKLVLMSLADYANEDAVAWPSRATLAEECEMSVDTVDRNLRKLEELGFIARQLRKIEGTGVHTSSIYQLNLDVGLQKKQGRANRLAHGGSRKMRPPTVVVQPELDFTGEVAAICGEGSRMGAATGSRTGAATGSRMGAATNELPVRTTKVELPLEEEREPTPNPAQGRGTKIVVVSSLQQDRPLTQLCDVIAAAEFERAGIVAIASNLEGEGYEVETGAKIANRGDGRVGRIDLVARRGLSCFSIALDGDEIRPKIASKLRNAPGRHIVVLTGATIDTVPDGVDAAVIFGPKEPAQAQLVGEFIAKGTPEWDAWSAHHAATRRLGPGGLSSKHDPVHRKDGRYERTQWPPGYPKEARQRVAAMPGA